MTDDFTQYLYKQAVNAINNAQWDKAAAFATTGLLYVLTQTSASDDGAGEVLQNATRRYQSPIRDRKSE
jgi:hypothetical protein